MIPDLNLIKSQMQEVLKNLPAEVTYKTLSQHTGGVVSPDQIRQFVTRGSLGNDPLRMVEQALEAAGLWPVEVKAKKKGK